MCRIHGTGGGIMATTATSGDDLLSGTSGADSINAGAGGGAEAGATVTLFDEANNNGIQDAGESALATATVSAGSFTADITLAEVLRCRGAVVRIERHGERLGARY